MFRSSGITLVLLASILTGTAGRADTLDLKDIVKVVGPLDPKFSIGVSSQDLERLAESLKEAQDIEPIEIDINDLYEPGDEAAITLASRAISSSVLLGAQDLVDLRALVYKLAALSTLDEVQAYETSVYKAYSKKIRKVYRGLIRRFSHIDPEIMNAIGQCRSEICVASIADAQRELLEFGRVLNRGFGVKRLTKTRVKWSFQNPLVKATVEAVFDSILPVNDEENLYVVLVKAAIVPFVAAARASVNVGKSALKFALLPTLKRLELKIKPIKDDYRAQKRRLDDLVYRTMVSIVNQQPIEEVPSTQFKKFGLVLKCRAAEIDYLIVAYGRGVYDCRSGDRDDGNRYRLTTTSVGLGLGIFADEEDPLVIAIASPTRIMPNGWWVGVDAKAGFVFGGGAGVYVGKGGSVATVLSGGLTAGAAVRLQAFRLKAYR